MPEFTVQCGKVSVRIASTHLSSSLNDNQTSVRQTQKSAFLKLCDEERTGPNAIITGDFNEDLDLPDKIGMKDAWLAAGHTHRSGWTIDNSTNGLSQRLIEDEVQGRYDRVFFRSSSLKLTSVELVGNQSVTAILGEPPLPSGLTWPDWLFCSDHYGVRATFSV